VYVVFFGMFGVMMELTFVALRDLLRGQGDVSLKGHISLWMFPVYALGLTYGFDLVAYLITNDWLRYLSYPFWVWAVEIGLGIPLSRRGIRLWNYVYLPEKYHWKGIISFAHFPVWMFFGFLIETVKLIMN